MATAAVAYPRMEPIRMTVELFMM